MAFGPAGLVAAAGAVLFLLLAALTAIRPAANTTRTRLFAAFLALFSLPLLNIVIADSGLALQFPRLLFIGNTLGLAAAPVLYLFAHSLALADFRLKRRDAVHFLPLLVIAALVAWQFHAQPLATRLAIVSGESTDSWLDAPAFVLLIFAYPLAYLGLTLRVVWRYERASRTVRSSSDGRELRWLTVSLSGLLGGAIVSMAHYSVVHVWALPLLSWALMAILSGGTLLLGGYFILSAFRSLDAAAPLEASAVGEAKYGEHRLAEDELAGLAAALDAHMAADAPHLDPDLTLEALARGLPMTARELSQVINRTQGLSFYEFIARWRVREAQRRLRADSRVSILTVMHDSGFSSKSSFAAAFRRETGMTPSTWRSRITGSNTRPRTT
ncbi:helix-turn-helix domain-containing protein [Hyphobacterium sp.]|uniref:AraC family transcriptional regulator n=1 Tax=Hyphobacterium sp. TaxID=2004662 RepID=UPI003B52BE1C